MKKLRFCRVGGLSSLKQKGHDNAPAKNGLYAFPEGFYDPFFVSGRYMMPWNKHHRFNYVRDSDGHIIDETHPLFEKYITNEKKYSSKSKKEGGKEILVKRQKLRTFEYTGDVWTRLETSSYIDKKGSVFNRSISDEIHLLNLINFMIIPSAISLNIGSGYSLQNSTLYLIHVS